MATRRPSGGRRACLSRERAEERFMRRIGSEILSRFVSKRPPAREQGATQRCSRVPVRQSTSGRSNAHAEHRTQTSSRPADDTRTRTPGHAGEGDGTPQDRGAPEASSVRSCPFTGEKGTVTVEVRLTDGERRLFRPRDLEEISPPKAWWRFLLGWDGGV